MFHEDGIFEGDTRGVGLTFSTDGLNPWRAIGSNYSMWPLVLQPLNFPPVIRKSVSSLFLLGIVPGNGSKEPKDLDPYIGLMVDELLSLDGCTIFDTYKNAPFKVKAKIILHVFDYPGICKVFCVPGSNAKKPCLWCEITKKHTASI